MMVIGTSIEAKINKAKCIHISSQSTFCKTTKTYIESLDLLSFYLIYFSLGFVKKLSNRVDKPLSKRNLDARNLLCRRLQCLLSNLTQVLNAGKMPH